MTPPSSSKTVVHAPLLGTPLDMADRGDVARVILVAMAVTMAANGLSHLLWRHLPAYQALPPPKRDEWNTRAISTAHAVLASV